MSRLYNARCNEVVGRRALLSTALLDRGGYLSGLSMIKLKALNIHELLVDGTTHVCSAAMQAGAPTEYG